MFFRCRLCQQNKYKIVHTKDAKTNNDLDIAICENCGFVQQVNVPTDEELKIYYSHNYRTDYKKTYSPKLKYVRRAGIAAKNRIDFLRNNVANIEKKSLLDVGAGGGEFVYISSKYTKNSFGVEPNEGYSDFAKKQYGCDIKTMMLDDLKSSSVDIVTMFHVLEHMANPEKVMAKIYEVLNEGGFLFVEVPNILQKDASPHNIFFKAHIFYYSRFTLSAVASAYFDVVNVEDDGNLKILFKRRDCSLSNKKMPQEKDVEFSLQRFSEKGWFEYLFMGGGVFKPLKKIIQTVQEKLINKDTSPREILDAINNN